jgi:hypothetical protein
MESGNENVSLKRKREQTYLTLPLQDECLPMPDPSSIRIPKRLISRFGELKRSLRLQSNGAVLDWLFSKCEVEIERVMQSSKENIVPPPVAERPGCRLETQEPQCKATK